ncbi:MAG: UDP-N-acetylmuramate dehydrogenase [Spirochaetaceae bacterium]|jgi:UDP-N-acetylmuramate dehydrogenase|nr:UDP-N-acetylmuramate dehydrogenase [Spirochaetaceae bacterium]
MLTLQKFIEKINSRTGFTGFLAYDEPMSRHTTFRAGGPADLFIRPEGEGFPAYAALLRESAGTEGIPLFILGGGANILVSDRGLRGVVLDTGGWRGAVAEASGLLVRSGTPVDEAVEAAAAAGLGGLEFLAGMPGTIGGAVWMNARCYDRSVSDVLKETEILDEAGARRWIPARPEDFGYKKSPFQGQRALIFSARFALTPRPEAEIRREMEEHRRDREAKGHYRYPSAGSVFKNNRAFGKPTGKLIDELGLRGLAIGGAMIAPWHGNIIINTGNARASEIRALTEETAARVKAALGFTLEPEILFAGDWGEGGSEE